ncbi:hypothetical protein Tco_1107611 [Tanacetum coccineum]
MNEDKIKKDLEEIETINIELDHRVSKLIAKNEHLKQTYKQLYDSIKPTRVRSKEQCDALVNQVNQKSVEISDLNASLQEKVLVITALKNELRKLKGKSVIACRESVNKPKVIAPVNLKFLCNAVLAYACVYRNRFRKLFVICSDSVLSSPLKSEKLVAVAPMNKARKVTFAKTSTTSDNNTQIQVDVHQTQTTNKPLVPSTNEKCSTNASRSKPRSETKNNRIMQPLSSNQKYQKVEAHTRNAKPSLTKEDMNDRARVEAVKSNKMKEWKPIGPALHEITPATISSGLVPNPSSSTPFVPPSRSDWDSLFQLMFDELFNPPPYVELSTPKIIASISEVVAPEPAVSTGLPSLTTVDQDTPYCKNNYENSSSTDVIYTVVPLDHQISEHNSKWTKNHPLENIIGELARLVSTRLQLHKQALFCYYDAFLTAV